MQKIILLLGIIFFRCKHYVQNEFCRFEKAVIPKNVFIYEVYNPGAVVRVWGRYSGGNWKILWEGPPRLCVETSRKFDPPIREICSVVK